MNYVLIISLFFKHVSLFPLRQAREHAAPRTAPGIRKHHQDATPLLSTKPRDGVRVSYASTNLNLRRGQFSARRAHKEP